MDEVIENNEELIEIIPRKKKKTRKQILEIDDTEIKKKEKRKTKKINDKLKLQEATEVLDDTTNLLETNKTYRDIFIKSNDDNIEDDPCQQKKILDEEINKIKKQRLVLSEACNDKKFKQMVSLNDKKLLDLIIYIFDKKIKNCQELFDLFPESNERTKGYLSKPYIFEALWKIIFLLRLDNLTDGFERIYRVSVEQNQDISAYDYLNGETRISKINSGSEGGIADFYFIVGEQKNHKKNTQQKACEEIAFNPEIKDVYVFTSKFYGKEKGISNYDIEKIALETLEKYEKGKFKVVSLVRNGAEFKNRLIRTSKEVIKNYIDSNLIYDESDLNLTYYPKLYKFLEHWFIQNQKNIKNDLDWREVLKDPREIKNISDNLRFHQKYVVEYTNDIINREENQGRFIWGAVARSGKSYMVGGLVAKRKPKFVLLILGAINETLSQFREDLFETYTDLKEYIIVDFQDKETKYKTIDADKKYVYIISQENLRTKIKNDFCKTNPSDKLCKDKQKKQQKEEIYDDSIITKKYDDSIITKIKEILKEEDKIIFFDEIHQGSGSDSMQENTIKFFYDNSLSTKIILIMVTATYAKPLAKYGKDIDGKDCILVEWNYEMIMKMKNFEIENVTIQKDQSKIIEKDIYLINSFDEDFENKMEKLKNITDELNKNGKSCQNIAYEYVNNPELVYLLPTLKEKYKGDPKLMDEDYNIIDTDNLEGEHKINIKHNLKEIFTLKTDKIKSFKYKNSVIKLLDYIYEYVYDELLEKTYKFVANGEGNIHSQLWFMPTSMKNDINKKKEEKEDPAIVAPMLKQLGILIINHPKFINFNVCVVHSGEEVETEISSNYGKLYFQCIKYKKNIKNCIRNIENKSKKENKSLIILTAQRLRLGISLPCVDVAIHMDDIKSYDIIYQSMFRVLTERPGKTHGYFVDMVIDRAIQFFYKYTFFDNKKNKLSDKIDENITKEQIKKNLLLFDVGSIKESIGFTNIDTPINSYSEIAEEFKIDKDEKFEQYKEHILKEIKENNKENNVEDDMKNNMKVVKRVLDTQDTEIKKKQVIRLLKNIYENKNYKDELKQIIQTLQLSKVQKSKKNDKSNNQKNPKGFKGTVIENELPDNSDNTDDDNKKNDDEQNDDDLTETFKEIVEQIKNIFSLLILFDDNSSLETILQRENLNIDNITDCKEPDVMYYCYLISTIDNVNKKGDIVKNKETGEIGEIIDIQKNDKITNFTIKFDDDIEKIYTSKDFDEKIVNLHIPNNFDLKNMDKNFIRNYIEKNIRLIDFLLSKEQNGEINNLFNNIKKEMTKITDKFKEEKLLFKDIPLKECPEDFIKNEKVLDIIRKYLTPKESEKKLFGEVFTPLYLVCEMLSKLPSDVWSNPDLKWLDPANGIGNFPVVVYYKLMEGLKNETIKGKPKSVWIIENMLYMNELNPVNVALSKKIFKMIEPNATPNVIKADFITNYDKVLDKMRQNSQDTERLFDVIIGNPPYNSQKSTGDNKPYLSFTFISLSILNKNGFLLFITPPSIYDYLFNQKKLKVTRELYSYDKLLNILYVNADNNYLKKMFKGVGSEFSYFLLKNNDYQGETHILYEKDNTIDSETINIVNETHKIEKLNINTNVIKQIYKDILEPEFISIQNKIFKSKTKTFEFKKAMFGNTSRRIRSEHIKQGIVKEEKTGDYKYKIIETYKIDKGMFTPNIYYINKVDDDYDKKRLIISAGPSFLYPYIINENSYTLSDNIYYVVCDGRNCNNLLFFLNSPLWKYIDKKYRPSNNINVYLMSLIEKIKPMTGILFKSNEDLYDFFGLTKNEILQIEEFSLNKTKSNKTLKNKDKNLKNKVTKNKLKSNQKNNQTKKQDTKKGGKKKTRKHKQFF
jgi:hypothetical protein